jgi:Plants and Prokaryotes Conserved (PCC) domain
MIPEVRACSIPVPYHPAYPTSRTYRQNAGARNGEEKQSPGTLSQDGGHLHLAVADHQGRTFGGHLAEGRTVRTTAEVVLAADDRLLFAREHDPATATTSLCSATATREARHRHRILATGHAPENRRLD